MKRISFGLIALSTLSGCVTTSSTSTSLSVPAPVAAPSTPLMPMASVSKFNPLASAEPAEPVTEVAIAWENRVMVTADSANNGRPLTGLAGRLYLFGPKGLPLNSSGAVTVVMHEVKADGSLGPQVDWTLDSATLKRLGRADMIGWGYTLFLPWDTYRPDVARVQLQAKLTPDGAAAPIFSPTTMVTLRQEGGRPQVVSETIPASARR